MDANTFAPLAAVFTCSPSPAVQQGRLWLAADVVHRIAPQDEDVTVQAIGRTADEANALYRAQVALVAQDKAPMLQQVAAEQRAFVQRAESAIALLRTL
jgi:hypothetical protein